VPYPTLANIVSILRDIVPAQSHFFEYGIISGKANNIVKKIVLSTELGRSISPDHSCETLILIPDINMENWWSDLHRKQVEALSAGVNIYRLPLKAGYLNKTLWIELGGLLGLTLEGLISSQTASNMYKLVVFVPPENLGTLRDELFHVGAGIIGDYTGCSFSVNGAGTFIPGKTAEPYSGESGKLNEVDEVRLEMVVPWTLLFSTIERIKKVHPYEEPAFDIYPLIDYEGGVSTSASFHISETDKFVESFERECRSVMGEVEDGKVIIILSGSGEAIAKAIFSGEGLFILHIQDEVYRLILEGAGVEVWDVGRPTIERLWLKTLLGFIQRALEGMSEVFSMPEFVII